MVRWLGSRLMLLQVVACADDSDNGNVKDEPQGSQLRMSSATSGRTTPTLPSYRTSSPTAISG